MVKSKNYSAVKIKNEPVLRTGNVVLDDFISNDSGFVIGSSIFLTGTSGAGKTTLAYTLQKVFENHVTSLYSREMSASAVADQMKRYAISHNNAYIADKDSHPTLINYIEELEILKPKVVIVDSLQVLMKEDYADMSAEKSGYLIIQMLREWTEKNDAVLIVVGHVNKDGEFEGKNTIKHMFDAHLEMIFDKKKQTRTLSWSKNRKGSTADMLYYIFGEETIEFFTENQWDTRITNKTMSDFMADSVFSFIEMFKTHKNYKDFYKEFIMELKGLDGDLNSVCTMSFTAQNLLKKHNII